MTVSTCPGCGYQAVAMDQPHHSRYHASAECWGVFTELSGHTQMLGDLRFPHQSAVDAYGAQHAGGPTRPITVAYSLIGLYLALERGFDGRAVQQAHMRMATMKTVWPVFEPPSNCDAVTAQATLTRSARDGWPTALRAWSESVWSCWTPEHGRVAALASRYLD